ncbi:heme-NO-binding protein [Sphaerotilus hippei]|uniref:Heme-NO-binding protein n=1 Tax=Sphaerotilus hippei TaxID=744406 RepID=A0A318HBQ1_9BURK|nr:heme NO-binding domain-containing protein [Sphaerotilus hippei]PXW96521.1 heme-NO-binding protein [Sphaerotilus hippei]
MYGFVNRGLEQMVTARGGREAWRRVCRRAHLGSEGFVSLQVYPDTLTLRLIDAVSEELEISGERVQESFGAYWVTHTAPQGYGELLQPAGRSLCEFLEQLSQVHRRVRASVPELELPLMEVERLAPAGHCRLRCSSSADGFTALVTGMLRGLAQVLGDPVDIELQEVFTTGGRCHTVFMVRRSIS